jgi:hypothetical protein
VPADTGIMRLSTFSRHSRSPVLLGHTEPDVVRLGSTSWYMFYRNDNTSKPSIGLMTSSNGLNWTEHGTILSASSSGFDSAEVIAPTVLFENGTWYLWYECDDASNPGLRRIGVATATNPIGPWTKRGIALQSIGGWEGTGGLLGTPAISKVGSRYCLWYHGFRDGADRLGVAYADNPLGPWTREPNNPLLNIAGEGSGVWDCCKVAPSSVIVYGNSGRFILFYEGWDGTQEHIWHWRVGIADGQVDPVDDRIKSLTRRTADPPNPVINLGLSGSADSVTSQVPSALIVGNQVWCYYSGNDGAAFRVCLGVANILTGGGPPPLRVVKIMCMIILLAAAFYFL